MLLFLTASWVKDNKRAGTSLYQMLRISTYNAAEDLCDLWENGQPGSLAKLFQSLIILDIKMNNEEYWK